MIRLSYSLDRSTPAYGGGEGVGISESKSIAGGDSCNTLDIGLSNHVGTHIDCPFHFDRNGRKLTDYPDDFWFCKNLQVLETKLNESELCTAAHLDDALSRAADHNFQAEIVILLTRWFKFRGEKKYWETPPGFMPETADLLRTKFPKIRFFGFDLISLSSFSHRHIGGECHRAFLADKHEILLLEDMNLAYLNSSTTIHNILISPLFIKDADGAPCTVWGNI